MQINILGTRGVPANHGGFETFAARLAPYLCSQGHKVVVYCQPQQGPVNTWREDRWNAVHRRHLRPRSNGARATMAFDLACARDVLKQPGVDLVLGYNTAVFNMIGRIAGRRIYMNMDGIEWRRAKWPVSAKIWFYLNEVAGANLSHVAIADHPEIAAHLARRSFRPPVVIPYGADKITSAPLSPLRALGLAPQSYLISIARVEPENSILEIVQAYSRLETKVKLVILGTLEDSNPYHRAVRAAAPPGVIFAGAIYDGETVSALRYHSRAYLHGHQVGGTNPSLVESLGAGNAVIAHDNRFNRWTAGPGQFFFSDVASATARMRLVIQNTPRVENARAAAYKRHAQDFRWPTVLAAYERLLTRATPDT